MSAQRVLPGRNVSNESSQDVVKCYSYKPTPRLIPLNGGNSIKGVGINGRNQQKQIGKRRIVFRDVGQRTKFHDSDTENGGQWRRPGSNDSTVGSLHDSLTEAPATCWISIRIRHEVPFQKPGR